MQVIPGALAAYRKEYLNMLEEEYLNQKFWGSPCTISDDRFLTLRIQTRFGKKVVFAHKAISYTYSPHTVIGFWKQLVRWKRGVLRELILVWREPKKNIKLLFLDMQFNFFMMNAMLVFKVFLIYNLLVEFSILKLGYTMVWFMLIASMFSSYMIVYNFWEWPYKILYTIMYEFFYVFTYLEAILRVRNQGKWVTR
jgi:cellulose synthase/poly-beta-1,6-N-acetylglucosamine synthase-like glycosyltransferase